MEQRVGTAAAAAATVTTTTTNNTSSWRLFVNNTYLIPPFMVNANNATCTLQDERAAALGRLIIKEQPDIVLLQEMWGAGQGSLEKEIAADAGGGVPTYQIGEYCKSYWGFTLLDSVMQYALSRGGLYFAHRSMGVSKPGTSLWGTYSVSKTKSKKGMVCIKYSKKQQSQQNAAVSDLLCFNTHLDPTNEDNVQLKQLAELARFINTSATAHATATHAGSSTSNKTDFGAVLVGDFNFAPGSPQYRELFKIFKEVGEVELREILPAASLATHTYSRDNKLVQWSSDCGRIDHIFAIDKVGALELKKVELLSEKVRSDVLVSDHYPIQVELKC